MVPRLCRVRVSSLDVTDTVSSVMVTAGSVEDPSTTGENDGHTSRLEEVMVPHVDEMDGPFALVFFVHLAEEHSREE